MRLLEGFLALLLCCAGLLAQGTGPAPADDLTGLARRLLQRQESQLELPDDAPPEASGSAPRRPERRVAPRGQRRSSNSGSGPRFSTGSFSIAEPVLWLMVGLAAIGLIVVIARSLGGGAARTAAPVKAPVVVRHLDDHPDAPQALPEHERLAAAGDFGAAIHALVRRAEQAFAEVAGALPVHATAREVVRRARARSLPVQDLGGLVRTFEVVHFGGQPADRRLYESSREQYELWRRVCRPKP